MKSKKILSVLATLTFLVGIAAPIKVNAEVKTNVEKEQIAEINVKEHTHNFSDWKITQNPTPSVIGKKERTCSCGEKEIKEIYLVAYEYLPTDDKNYIATSERLLPSWWEYYGTGYSYITSDQKLNTFLQSHTEADIFKSSTCYKLSDIKGHKLQFKLKSGKVIDINSNINLNLTVEEAAKIYGISLSEIKGVYYIPILPHKHLSKFESKGEVIKPTCTQEGFTKHTCEKCKTIFKDNITKATGHSFSKWKIVKNPTENEDGLKEKTCKCGEKESIVIPKLKQSSSMKEKNNNLEENNIVKNSKEENLVVEEEEQEEKSDVEKEVKEEVKEEIKEEIKEEVKEEAKESLVNNENEKNKQNMTIVLGIGIILIILVVIVIIKYVTKPRYRAKH